MARKEGNSKNANIMDFTTPLVGIAINMKLSKNSKFMINTFTFV